MKRLLSILLLVVIYNFNSVAQVFNKSGERFQMQDLKSFAEKASYYDERGDYNEAIKYKMKEIQATEYIYGTMSEQLLIALQSTSIMCDKYYDSEAAIMISKQQGEIQAALWGKNNWNYAIYLRLLGQFYSNAQKYDISINTFKESIDIFENKQVKDNQYALALSFIAQDYYKIGDNSNSMYYHKKCLEVRREIGDGAEYLNEINIILIMSRNADFLSRFKIIEQELNNLPSCVNKYSQAIVSIYKEIARHYYFLNDYISADNYCDKALAIIERIENAPKEEFAYLLAQKCKYQRLSRSIDAAISNGEKAKYLYDLQGIKTSAYANLLEDLAFAYGIKYDFEKAINLQKEVVRIYENNKDWLSIAESYNAMGNYSNYSEDLDSAENYFNLALDVLSKHDDANKIIDEEIKRTGNQYLKTSSALASISMRIDYIKISSYQSLARVYQKRGNYNEAINLEKENTMICKNRGDILGYCSHLWNLSEYYRGNKQFNEAIECLEECLKNTSTNNSNALASSYMEMSQIYYEKEDLDKAIKYIEEAINTYKSNDDIDNGMIAEYILSYYYWKNGKIDQAEKKLSELLDFFKDISVNEIVHMTSEQKQRIWSLYEPKFLFYRNVIELSKRDDNLLSKLYNYILFSKGLLLDIDIDNGDNQVTSRLKTTWKDVQMKLSNEDIAIEFFSTIDEKNNSYNYHALIVDCNCQSPNMVTLYSESDLEKLKRSDTRNVSDIVGELIWKPILDKYNSIKNIYFSPDGILHQLPIEFLKVNNMGYMIERYNMYRLSSTKELCMAKDQAKQINAVFYGGLDYNQSSENTNKGILELEHSLARGLKERGGFEPLSNTLAEIQDIQRIMKKKGIATSLYTGAEGSEESFKMLSDQGVNIIHLATHGMYINSSEIENQRRNQNFDFLESINNDNNPVKEDVALTHSFLVMSGGNKLIRREQGTKTDNGILTAKEISQVNLSGLDLVVLSACESGRGDIEYGGVYGLQRGFKKAGANTILMSLDKVDDEATKIMMIEFYRNLMDGKTKLQSLRSAQKYLRTVENGKYDNPKFWASFIMLDGLN